jgi:hypothetical protein
VARHFCGRLKVKTLLNVRKTPHHALYDDTKHFVYYDAKKDNLAAPYSKTSIELSASPIILLTIEMIRGTGGTQHDTSEYTQSIQSASIAIAL